MTEYQFHWRRSETDPGVPPAVSLNAESKFHGAALALRHFKHLGYDLAAPLAHLDVTAEGGVKETLLVEEVLDWLIDPQQAAFVEREGLIALIN